MPNAIGANLDALLHEANPKARWPMLRDDLQEIARDLVKLAGHLPLP